MLFRILGGISLLLGGLFGLLALLIFLPFLDNFNTSLLILAAVFGVLAWILLSIGWQLIHPPEILENGEAGIGPETGERVAPGPGERPPSEAPVGEPEAVETAPAASDNSDTTAEGTAEAGGGEEAREAAPEPEPEPEPPLPRVRSEQTFISLGEPEPAPRGTPASGSEPGTPAPPTRGESPAGQAAGETSGAEPTEEGELREGPEEGSGERDGRRGYYRGGHFKKPGAPVPSRRDRDRE